MKTLGSLRAAEARELAALDAAPEADVVATRDADPGATEARVGLGSLDGARGAAILMGIAGGLSACHDIAQGAGAGAGALPVSSLGAGALATTSPNASVGPRRNHATAPPESLPS